MRTIHISPEFPLNRRMRRAVRRGKLQVVREGGERLSLGGGMAVEARRAVRTVSSPLVCMADGGAEVGGGGEDDSKVVYRTWHPEEYANGYKIAADILCGHPSDEIEPNSLMFPIFHLYRHYVEIEMKLLCRRLGGMMIRQGNAKEGDFAAGRTHDLRAMWKTAKKCLMKAAEVEGVEVTYSPGFKRKSWGIGGMKSGQGGRPFADEQPAELEKKGNDFDKIVEFFHRSDPIGDRGRYPMNRAGYNHNAFQKLDVADLKRKTDKFSALFQFGWTIYDAWSTLESDAM